MKKLILIAFACLAVSIPGMTGSAAAGELPVIQGEKAVAEVNEETITLAEFNEALASLPGEEPAGEKAAAKEKTELLQRLINSRLIVQEGRRMGLHELPEIAKQADVYGKVTLREHLIEHRAKDIKGDAKEAERIYRDAIREWKINSVLFEKKDEAGKMLAALKGGKDFGAAAQPFIAAGTAKGGDGGKYMKARDIDPQIAVVVAKLKPGSVSPLIPIKNGFVLVKLEALRSVENAGEKERARREALNKKRVEALKDYNDVLIKKYVKVNKDVLAGINFDAKEQSFSQLLKDKRVIAEIKGEPPVTVADLSEHLRQQLYHGVERAIESRKLNAKKSAALDEMLYKKVFRKEALRLGLDKTKSYAHKVRAYEDSLVFGAFVQKAVAPDVKLKEDDIKAYYEEHAGEYAFPEMMRISGLAFAKRADAEKAVEKMKAGTAFQWLAANAEGQADRNSKGLLTFDGQLVTTSGLPEGIQKAVAGAKSGDVRLYAAPEGYFYLLSLQEVVPSKPRAYQEAREEIARKLFDEKLRKALDGWTDRLRAASDVKVYIN